MLKKAIVLIILFALIISFSVTGYAEEKTLQDWTSSVVRIVAFDSSGNWLWHGSGFAIGTEQPVQYFITNNHVIDGGGQQISLYVLRNKDDLVEAVVEVALPNADVAVIKTRDKLYGYDPFVLCDEDEVSIGDFTYALGFPGASIADNYSDSYQEDVTITKGIISKKTVSSTGISVFQTDTQISSGNSGGPLLNGKNEVIGINTFVMLGTTADINGSVMISYATDILDSRGIAYLSSKDVKPEQEGEAALQTTPKASEIRIQETPVATQDLAIPVQQKAPMSKMLLLIISGAGLFILAGVIVIISISKGKKYSIGTITGEGLVIPYKIAANPVTIGRDASVSQIVNSAEKISRKHCTVAYINGKFCVTDLSSNGTFLRDGTRLEHGKPHWLNDGESFYLVNKKHMYLLKK